LDSALEDLFFDKSLNWLCHRTDKTGKNIFCTYYLDWIAIIKEEKERKDDVETIQDKG
jgi:hypothetical protein